MAAGRAPGSVEQASAAVLGGACSDYGAGAGCGAAQAAAALAAAQAVVLRGGAPAAAHRLWLRLWLRMATGLRTGGRSQLSYTRSSTVSADWPVDPRGGAGEPIA